MPPDSSPHHPAPLVSLTAGQPVIVGGDRVVHVSPELAAAFVAGDRLVVVPETGDLLHIPAAEHQVVDRVVGDALAAFAALGQVTDEQIDRFFLEFADHLADDERFAPIAQANAADVERAREAGRSTTRLALDGRMRRDMVGGLRMWASQPGGRDRLVERVDHDGWHVEARTAPLGVVGFVFEGRPNVFADATGVVRTGNAVVFRIGSDALGTARAIVEHALDPALAASGLPPGTVGLVDARSHAAGWALFADPRLALAVARGSGPAVAQLGSVARQAGTPVSLHGTGGAWLVAGEHAEPGRFALAVLRSLDRKVCNTLNVCAIPRSRAGDLVPALLDAADEAGDRLGCPSRLHVVAGSEQHVPDRWFSERIRVRRAAGEFDEPRADVVEVQALATEWEWEAHPELTLVVVDDVQAAIDLCNTWSPRFVASIISDDEAEVQRFWTLVDAPFVGNGFTRWVDGQYALDRPELGLSNWQHGRLFARGGVLSGESVHTVRLRAVQADPELHR